MVCSRDNVTCAPAVQFLCPSQTKITNAKRGNISGLGSTTAALQRTLTGSRVAIVTVLQPKIACDICHDRLKEQLLLQPAQAKRSLFRSVIGYTLHSSFICLFLRIITYINAQSIRSVRAFTHVVFWVQCKYIGISIASAGIQ